MSITDVNSILTLCLIMAACAAAAVWLSPKAAMWLACRLRARSLALEAARATYRATFEGLRAEGEVE